MKEAPLVTLRKEEPPQAITGRGNGFKDRYAEQLAVLASDPGQWYAILDYGERVASASSMALRARRAVPEYEFLARGGIIYGRYRNGK